MLQIFQVSHRWSGWGETNIWQFRLVETIAFIGLMDPGAIQERNKATHPFRSLTIEVESLTWVYLHRPREPRVTQPNGAVQNRTFTEN